MNEIMKGCDVDGNGSINYSGRLLLTILRICDGCY